MCSLSKVYEVTLQLTFHSLTAQAIYLSPTFELALQTGKVLEQMGKFLPNVSVTYAINCKGHKREWESLSWPPLCTNTYIPLSLCSQTRRSDPQSDRGGHPWDSAPLDWQEGTRSEQDCPVCAGRGRHHGLPRGIPGPGHPDTQVGRPCAMLYTPCSTAHLALSIPLGLSTQIAKWLYSRIPTMKMQCSLLDQSSQNRKSCS